MLLPPCTVGSADCRVTRAGTPYPLPRTPYPVPLTPYPLPLMWDPGRHPDHELAKRIFTSGGPNSDASQQTFGGMLAFILKGDPDTAMKRGIKMCERLRLVTLAVSLGGTESLIQHPASMTHAMIPREKRLAGGLQDGLVRLSVGLESANDICDDIRQALDGCDGP